MSLVAVGVSDGWRNVYCRKVIDGDGDVGFFEYFTDGGNRGVFAGFSDARNGRPLVVVGALDEEYVAFVIEHDGTYTAEPERFVPDVLS